MPIKYPVIKCLPRDDFFGGMMFWCPFCKKWHRHGIGAGHRVAHCTNPNSPYSGTGYIIKMMSKSELRRIREGIDDQLGDA